MAQYFTSDTHYFHKNIIRYCLRPFKDVAEMNRVMISRWNERVGPKDTVYHLGDFAFGVKFKKESVREDLAKIVRKLNGKKILVAGNHDPSAEYMRAIGFDEVYDSLIITVDGKRLYLNHQPEEDWTDKNGKGCDLALCGHVHEKWAKLDLIYNVGVDQCNFYPLTLDQVLAR